MDEPLIRAWGPPRYVAVGALLVTIVLLGLALATDPVGRVLLVAGALLLAFAGGWALLGPALVAGPEGVRVRGLVRTHVVAWDEIDRILIDDRRRSRAVELETASTLIAVPALLLGGVSPQTVAAQLRELRAAARARPTPTP